MKKLNLICASIAALFAAGAANAGTAVATPTKIAIENFGGAAASQNTLAILGAPISYSMSSITAVNSGSTVYFTVRLTGGKFAAAPSYTNFTFGGQGCSSTAAAANPLCVVTASTDKSTIKVAVTTAASYTLGLGAFTYTPVAADIDNVNSTLATVGGKVSASIGLVTLNPTGIESTDTQATIDAPLATGDLAIAAQTITGAISASSYTGKIDLTVSPAASNYTTAGYAILGQYKFDNAAAGTGKRRDGTADFTLVAGSGGADNSGATVTVTPGAGQAFPIGSVLSLSSSATCASTLAGASASSAAITSLTASTAKTLTTTAAVVTGTPYYVCMTAPSTGNTAAPIQASMTATVNAAATSDSIGSASGNGYSLGYNGSTVDVQTYWPGALDAYSYKGYLRITNTGSVAAAISAQHYTTAGALTGSATQLNIAGKLPTGTLAAGQSVLLSTKDIDALIGANPSGLESGRIRITAPTDGLRVQSLLQTGSDAPIEYNNKVVVTGGAGGNN